MIKMIKSFLGLTEYVSELDSLLQEIRRQAILSPAQQKECDKAARVTRLRDKDEEHQHGHLAGAVQ